MSLKPLFYRIRNWLDTESGKRFLYEIKSFIMTFIGALVALLAIDPVVNNFIQTGVFDISTLVAIWSAITIAFGRSLSIYLGRILGIGDYRSATKKY